MIGRPWAALRAFCRRPDTVVVVRSFATALAIACLFAGCVAVHPWERGDHARRAMVAGFGDNGLIGRHRAKLVETRTGHGAAAGAPGGGCGCSQ